MASERVVIEIETDDTELDATITKLQKMGLVSKDNAKTFTNNSKKRKKAFKEEGKEVNKLATMAKKAGGAIAAAFAAQQLLSFAKGVTDITAEFEKLRAVLKTSLGSGSEADKAFAMIQDFAAKTPFSVKQLTGSFVKLVNQGFKPTQKEMTKLGDLAASTGKDFDQLAEAIIDAQVGEFERLKEFGIRAQKEGDRVKFTFKGVKTEVANTEKAIQGYLLSLGEASGVSGSMAAISETLGGKISNLGDSWDSWLFSLGKTDTVLGQIIRASVDLASTLLTSLTPAQKKQSDLVEATNAQFNIEVETLKRGNLSQENRSKLIAKINSKYGEYLPNLIKESDTVQDIAKAQEAANAAFRQKITLLAAEEALQEITRKRLDLELEQLDLQMRLSRQEKEYADAVDNSSKTLNNMSSNHETARQNIVATELAIKENTSAAADMDLQYEKVMQAATDLGVAIGGTSGDGEGGTSRAVKELTKDFVKQNETWNATLVLLKKLNGEFPKLEESIDSSSLLMGTKLAQKKAVDDAVMIVEEGSKKSKDQQIEDAEDAARTVLGIASDLGQTKTNMDINELEKRKAAGLVSEEQYNTERKKILRNQAKQDKALALFDIAIATSVAIAKASPLVPLMITAGIVGAAQAAAVGSRPLPQLRKGGTPLDAAKAQGMLKGASHEGGGIMIEAEGNEYLMPVDKSKRYRKELDEMRMGVFNTRTPKVGLIADLLDAFEPMDDQNIVNELKSVKRSSRKQVALLAKLAKGKHVNERNSWG